MVDVASFRLTCAGEIAEWLKLSRFDGVSEAEPSGEIPGAEREGALVALLFGLNRT